MAAAGDELGLVSGPVRITLELEGQEGTPLDPWCAVCAHALS